jgi:GT2 family glycosyltransferase
VEVVGPAGLHDRGTTITEPLGRRTYHQRVARRREGDCSACDSVAEVDGGIGCCMMYRREVAREVGGYDPAWAPVWFDDLDLTLGIRRHGLKVFYLPDVRVVHHVGRRVRRRMAGVLPRTLRRRISQRLGLDRPRGEEWARLQHHYAYWREKWGFDMLNPDMEAVLERWGGTEISWAYDRDMRQAGEEIVAAYQPRP